MLRSEAIAAIQRGAGFREDQEDTIIAALVEAQRLLERGRTLPRFLIEEDASLLVPTGSAEVALPVGYLRDVTDEPLRYTDASVGKLVILEKFTSLSWMLSTESLSGEDATPGRPLAYYLRSSTMVVLPERDADYTLTWSYYKAAESLSNDVENVWLANAPDILIGKAGMRLTENLGASDPGMQRRFQAFKDLYVEAWQGQFGHDIERERENYPLSMGARL